MLQFFETLKPLENEIFDILPPDDVKSILQTPKPEMLHFILSCTTRAQNNFKICLEHSSILIRFFYFSFIILLVKFYKGGFSSQVSIHLVTKKHFRTTLDYTLVSN